VIKRTILLLFISLLLAKGISARDVVFVDITENQSEYAEKLAIVCNFYGLSFKQFCISDKEEESQFLHYLDDNENQGIIITARSLPFIDEKLFRTMFQESEDINLLIIGVSTNTDNAFLQYWSQGQVNGIKEKNISCSDAYYKVCDVREITKELSNQAFKFVYPKKRSILYFDLNTKSSAQPIIKLSANNIQNSIPIFVKVNINKSNVFFAVSFNFYDTGSLAFSKYKSNWFISMLPLFMFFKYTFADYCWHSTEDYANLTIDDPWLTKSYGHLSYIDLFGEMGKINFHTTIAFIPWNFDRSEPNVVTFFRDNPKSFSICIHGNDHDHQEFYKYETKIDDPWPEKPLNVQEAEIRQALARMAKFKELTGISYDKVMVFPHGIAPARTLGLLKKFNFLATVNSGNVPLGSKEPEDPMFRLRSVTMKFESFPSLNRYSPSRTQGDIAIDLFLDNPLLFYAHHDFFEDGINAFNETAEMVNNIQPDIIWESLGNICQHLYLEKLRADGHYDVMAFSSNFILENTHKRDLIYFVQKEESFSMPIRQVTVDGGQYSYKKSDSNLLLGISIPAGESRHIIIDYENELGFSLIDISKNDLRVNRLRSISDFRDMTLSKNVFGRTFTRVYYDTGIYKFGLMRLAIVSVVFLILMILVTLYFIKRKKRQKKI